MPLESATYIDGLVTTNPLGSDPLSAADDHIRLIKASIKNTFPNINGAVNSTDEDLNQVMRRDGTTMTGSLVLNGNPSTNLQAAPKQYVDSSITSGITVKADKAITVTGTGGLTGGGDISTNRSLSIADGGVSTAKIADGAVTAGKMASGAAVGNIGFTPANQASFTGSNQSVAATGYQKLPGGLILQWGKQEGNISSAATTTFPIAFPNAVFSITATGLSAGATQYSNPVNIDSRYITNTSFVMDSPSVFVNGAYWFAIGY